MYQNNLDYAGVFQPTEKVCFIPQHVHCFQAIISTGTGLAKALDTFDCILLECTLLYGKINFPKWPNKKVNKHKIKIVFNKKRILFLYPFPSNWQMINFWVMGSGNIGLLKFGSIKVKIFFFLQVRAMTSPWVSAMLLPLQTLRPLRNVPLPEPSSIMTLTIDKTQFNTKKQ